MNTNDSYVTMRDTFQINTDNGIETYVVNATLEVPDGKINVSFASSIGYDTKNDNRFFKVLPAVMKSVTQMFAGYNYTRIAFSPVINADDKNKNMRLRGYNIFARRLFGKYSLLGQSEDSTIIPVPEVFQNRIGKDYYQVNSLMIAGDKLAINDPLVNDANASPESYTQHLLDTRIITTTETSKGTLYKYGSSTYDRYSDLVAKVEQDMSKTVPDTDKTQPDTPELNINC